MIWPRTRRGGGPWADVDEETAASTVDDETPFWTQNDSRWTAATDPDDTGDNQFDEEDGDDLAWSQPASPAWEVNPLAESPFIPSAQPVFYPFSLPASGIRPLTPPSPVRPRLDSNDSWVSELDTDSEVDDMLDHLLQGVSGMAL